MIDPEGNLYFCPVHKNLIAGNIHSKNFDNLWENLEAKDIKEFFRQGKCHCWLSCTNSDMMTDTFFKHKNDIISSFKTRLNND